MSKFRRGLQLSQTQRKSKLSFGSLSVEEKFYKKGLQHELLSSQKFKLSGLNGISDRLWEHFKLYEGYVKG
jgi:hypothetical protein